VFTTLLSAYQACEDDFLVFLKTILLLLVGGEVGWGMEGGGRGISIRTRGRPTAHITQIFSFIFKTKNKMKN
jgi:hypothetical protein